MPWFRHPASPITNSPTMPLSFEDAVSQAFHIDCGLFNISIRIDNPKGWDERRGIFLWRKDTNFGHTCKIENRFSIAPGGFILLEALEAGRFRIRKGLTGGVKDEMGFLPFIYRIDRPIFESN